MPGEKSVFEPFWDKCGKIADKLWLPSFDLYCDPDQADLFHCNHPSISFDYYFHNDAKIHKSLHFLDVPLPAS